MTIDEAITRAREVAEIHRNNDKLNKTLGKSSPYYNTDCIKCAEEHEQLAEWLEELKFIRQWKSDVMDEFCKYDCNSVEEALHYGYNKAIDDFVEKLIIYVDCGHLCSPAEIRWSDLSVVEMVNKLAEQLKAGVENDNLRR